MSLLVVDAGNSRTRFACVDAGRLRHIGQAPTGTLSTARLPSGDEVGTVSAVRVAAVGGVGPLLSDWAREVLGVRAEILVSPLRGEGLINAYGDRAQDLGVDRWVAMLAARRYSEGALLVVDAGTALTLDSVSSTGQHLGGYIVPGLSLARRSLSEGTAVLPETATGGDGYGLADDTVSAIRHGTLAQVAALVNSARAAIPGEVTVVVTGGDAEILIPVLAQAAIHASDLVLDGLASCDPASWIH
jgi:type III pantothenate kinase